MKKRTVPSTIETSVAFQWMRKHTHVIDLQGDIFYYANVKTKKKASDTKREKQTKIKREQKLPKSFTDLLNSSTSIFFQEEINSVLDTILKLRLQKRQFLSNQFLANYIEPIEVTKEKEICRLFNLAPSCYIFQRSNCLLCTSKIAKITKGEKANEIAKTRTAHSLYWYIKLFYFKFVPEVWKNIAPI